MVEMSVEQLIEWLNLRRKLLVCITGPSGAGKSTLIKQIVASKRLYHHIAPGQHIRKCKTHMKTVLKSTNPTAVPELEKAVSNYVIYYLKTVSHNYSPIIDGMPRTPDQIKFCINLAQGYNRLVVFVYVHADENTRRDRLFNRKAENLELMERRIKSDNDLMPVLFQSMMNWEDTTQKGHLIAVQT